MRVYLSGPMTGLRWGTAAKRASYVRGRLEAMGCSVYSPSEVEALHHDPDMVIGSDADMKSRHPLAQREAFFAIDKGEVFRSDTVFVDLRRARRPTIGADFEMAWAHVENKLMVIVVKKDSVYDRHPFTRACGAVVFHELDDALLWLEHYLRQLGEPILEPPDDEEEE